jgi:NAD(P)-dependent dehydrogenase (short-subunit alcohol dehydrogenase family)
MMVDHPDELWHRTIDVNLTGPYRTIKLCLPGMVERKWGRIVNLATTGARVGHPGHAAMCSSKTGLLGLTRCVALEGAPHGVTCNAINPGSVRSPHVVRVAIPNKLKMLGIDQKVDDYLAHIPDDTPQKRWIEAEEIGAFAAFLCREEALGLTMEDVQISGGASW